MNISLDVLDFSHPDVTFNLACRRRHRRQV